MSSLADTIVAGANNPDCAFFVGLTTGQFLIFKIVGALIVVYVIAKFMDTLVLNPLLKFLKRVIYRRRE